MSKWNELKGYVVARLAQRLIPSGFVWVRTWNQFRKPTQEGFINFVLSMSDYDDGFMLEGHCGVRINHIEDAVFAFTRGLKSFQPQSHTLICSTAKLEEVPIQRFLIASEQQADDAIRALGETLEEHAESFWADFTQLKNLDALFNAPDARTRQLVTNLPQAYLRGLVVAHLLERSDFEDLVDKQRTRMEDAHANPLLMRGFEDLVTELRGHWLH